MTFPRYSISLSTTVLAVCVDPLNTVSEMLVLLVRQVLETFHCFFVRVDIIQNTPVLFAPVLKVTISGVDDLKTHRHRVRPSQALDGSGVPRGF